MAKKVPITNEWDALYVNTQNSLLSLAQAIEMIDLDEFIGRIEKAQKLGLHTDPVIMQTAGDNLPLIKSLAYSAFEFQRAVADVRDEAEEVHQVTPRDLEAAVLGICVVCGKPCDPERKFHEGDCP